MRVYEIYSEFDFKDKNFKLEKGSNYFASSRDKSSDYEILPTIYEEAETSPVYREKKIVDQINSFNDYNNFVKVYPPLTQQCGQPINSCDPCNIFPSCYPQCYEQVFDCQVQPMYQKISKNIPIIDPPILLSDPCPPAPMCSPKYLPTIYRKYHGQIGNPKVLAEYVDIIDRNCCPKRVYSKEYSDQDLVRQVGYCYTYKVPKRRDPKPRSRVMEPKIVYRTEPKRVVIDEGVKIRKFYNDKTNQKYKSYSFKSMN